MLSAIRYRMKRRAQLFCGSIRQISRPAAKFQKNVPSRNYFYCHEDENGERSFLGEKFLGDLESASSDVLRAAQNGYLPTTLRDRFTLTGYVAMSLVRTPAGKRLMDQATIGLRAEDARSDKQSGKAR